MPPMDIVYFVQGFGALLVTWKPQIITPKTLDAAVIVCFLAWNISLLPLSDRVDARDVVTVSFTVRFVFSVMARRHSTVIICLLLNFLQVGWMASVQSDMHVCGSQIQQAPLPNLLFSVMVLMAVGLYIARKMMEDNAMLKQALDGRTIELGAVCSLLNASYDAVVEVDETWKLLGDARQLSTMLGCSDSESREVRRSLLDFFTKEDQKRISQQVQSSINAESTSVMALHVDMLTLDQRPVKVELFHAQFRSLANQRFFLVGLRELSDEPLLIPQATSSCCSREVVASEDLFMAFDVESFEMFIVSSAMDRLYQERFGKSPDTVLEISSAPEVLRSQLQRLVELAKEQNCEDPAGTEQETTFTFNLVGAGDVSASLSLEHDPSLRRMVGILTFAPTVAGRFTEVSVPSLDFPDDPRVAPGAAGSASEASAAAAASAGSTVASEAGRQSERSRQSQRSQVGSVRRWPSSGFINKLHKKTIQL